MAFSNTVVKTMLPNIIESLINQSLDDIDEFSLKQWVETCEASWTLFAQNSLNQKETMNAKKIVSSLLNTYKDLVPIIKQKKYKTTTHWSTQDRISSIERLTQSHQIEQRTDQWYKDAMNLLTASQFHTILKKGRTRALLVMDKVNGNVNKQRSTVCISDYLTPFAWGIRFEPLVKEIYQHLTNTKVKEMGRLHHRTETHLAASPDGLVEQGPEERLGRFVEFKAPVSREINNKIPEEYMTQMQIQMEVGDINECDYLEVKFNSKYLNRDVSLEPKSTRNHLVYYGVIYILEKKTADEVEENVTLRYAYSPLNTVTWEPEVYENETIVEKIPWWTDTWFLTTVGRSTQWFQTIAKPSMDDFWKDVGLAKNGMFIVPESTRKKSEKCKIINDDNDNE